MNGEGTCSVWNEEVIHRRIETTTFGWCSPTFVGCDIRANAAAEKRIAEVRTGKFSNSQTTERIRNWVFPNGTLNAANRDALTAWMKKDTIDLGLPHMPLGTLVEVQNPLLESDRQRAIVDLKIP